MKKLFLCICAVLAAVVSGAELMDDPDFSKAKFGDIFPPGWKSNIPGNGGSCKIIVPTGINMLRVRVANKSFIFRSDKYIAVTPGEKLTAGAKISGNGNFSLSLLFFGRDGRFAGSLSEKFKASGANFYQKTFTVPRDFKGKVPGKMLYQLSFDRGMFDVIRVSVADNRTTPDTMELQKKITASLDSDGIAVVPNRELKVYSLTVPAGVTLRFLPKSKLNFLPGSRLTVYGKFDAPLKEIISGKVDFAGMADISDVYPQWFGARGDDKHDDGPALQKAADFARFTRNRKLNIPAGRYRFEQKIRMSCNVEAYGTLVQMVEPDYKKGNLAHYVLQYPMVKMGGVVVSPDEEAVFLDPEAFYGIKADSFRLPRYAGIPLANNPARKVDLLPGGTLILKSTDFFTARKVNNSDHVYECNDVFEITSPLGAVFPEACFDYVKRSNVPEWSKDKVYKRGDYVKRNGEIYKASYPSGPGIVHKDPFKGTAPVGVADPAASKSVDSTLTYPISYSSGRKDVLMIWRRVRLWASYVPPQVPLVINNLAIELVSKVPLKEYTQIKNPTGCFSVTRSNVTVNGLRVESKEKFYRFYMLASIRGCVNVTFNNARVSGANHSSGGYNISNSNVGNVTFNNCISTNCRDSIGGRHGKYVTINGGHYGVIDDHYGKNYYINNVTFYPVEPWVPGFYTPKADHQKWFFRSTCCVRFGGRDITIENCRVYGGGSFLHSRPDTGDFGGRVVLRNISVLTDLPFNILYAGEYEGFDYAHKVLVPSEVIVENISNEGKGPLRFIGSKSSGRWKVRARNIQGLREVRFYNTDWFFTNCSFKDADFRLRENFTVTLTDCLFEGSVKGFDPKKFTLNSGVKMPDGKAK